MMKDEDNFMDMEVSEDDITDWVMFNNFYEVAATFEEVEKIL